MKTEKLYLITCKECKNKWVTDTAPCGDVLGTGKNLLGVGATYCSNCGTCGGDVTYINFIKTKPTNLFEWWSNMNEELKGFILGIALYFTLSTLVNLIKWSIF